MKTFLSWLVDDWAYKSEFNTILVILMGVVVIMASVLGTIALLTLLFTVPQVGWSAVALFVLWLIPYRIIRDWKRSGKTL